MIYAYLNMIATAVPEHDIHSKFVSYAPQLLKDERDLALFARMAERSQIEYRYSFLELQADEDTLDKMVFIDLVIFRILRKECAFTNTTFLILRPVH